MINAENKWLNSVKLLDHEHIYVYLVRVKTIAAILSLLVFSMVVLPAFAMKNNPEKPISSCCTSDQQENDSGSDDCCDKGCNPFVNCCGMMGFLPKSAIKLVPVLAPMQGTVLDTYLEPASNYTVNIWHPPQV